MDQMVPVDRPGHLPQRLAKRELKQWAVPRAGLSLDDLAASIRASQAEAGLNDPIIEMDYENNRILVNHVIQEFQP